MEVSLGQQAHVPRWLRQHDRPHHERQGPDHQAAGGLRVFRSAGVVWIGLGSKHARSIPPGVCANFMGNAFCAFALAPLMSCSLAMSGNALDAVDLVVVEYASERGSQSGCCSDQSPAF